MQKVSKQSLAMLALSILLAVSIALTLTFAALADSKTATGTITFSDGFTLEISGFTGTGSDEFKVNPTYNTNGDVTFAIDEANKDAEWTITTTDAQTMEVIITLTGEGQSGVNPVALDSAVTSGTTYSLTTTGASTTNIALADLIALSNTTATAIDTGSVSELTYTIKVDVKVVSSTSASALSPDVAKAQA